jgi:hypothetical protein
MTFIGLQVVPLNIRFLRLLAPATATASTASIPSLVGDSVASAEGCVHGPFKFKIADSLVLLPFLFFEKPTFIPSIRALVESGGPGKAQKRAKDNSEAILHCPQRHCLPKRQNM